MRLLGLDVGDRRIGAALSDPLGFTAQRLVVIERTRVAADIEAIRQLTAQHHVEAIVIGLPLTLRGERGIQAHKVEAFGETLRQRLALPIHWVDERLTTVEGERALLAMDTRRKKRKQQIDQVAAQLILQQFLDAQRPTHT